MATVFKLIIEDDEGKTTVYPLSNGDVSIGRRDGNTIRLMERNVSRRHARLHRKNGEIFIEDLDSYNGIKINGERIAGRYEVKEGDLVEIGDFHLALQRAEIDGAQPQTREQQRPWAGDPKGTIPDWPLPPEVVGEKGRKTAPERIRDTILDQPLESLQADGPVVKPPPRQEPAPSGSGDLPSFPAGGLPASRSETAKAESPAPAPSGGLSPGPAVTAAVPRLVCVSTTYAGKEFAITRPELIIGRVEDNDIVIEHRSVSRNHAKVLFDGRTHKIIDLQSANGILVNGEEYAMTDLRKGDLIELGHVRFRFIPAHQSFAPTDEENEQMREAGVEPPVAQTSNGAASDVPMPSYDPSQAQTVTDTPLDVIGMRETFAPSVQASTATDPKAEAKTEKPAKATDDARATELNRLPDRSEDAQSSLPTADMHQVKEPAMGYQRASTAVGEDFDQWEEPASRRLWVGLLGLLALIAVALLAFLLAGQGDTATGDTHDVAIQQMYEAGRYEAIDAYYNEHINDFADTAKANELRVEAAKKMKGSLPSSETDLAPEDELLDEFPGDESQDDTALDDTALDDTALDDDEAQDDESQDDEALVEKARGTKKVVKNRSRRRNSGRRKDATKRQVEAQRLLLLGNLSGAKAQLDYCLKINPGQAICHRMLGVYHARTNDTPQSLHHYRKYLALAPNAPDADSIREIVRKATSEE